MKKERIQDHRESFRDMYQVKPFGFIWETIKNWLQEEYMLGYKAGYEKAKHE